MGANRLIRKFLRGGKSFEHAHQALGDWEVRKKILPTSAKINI